ncbi:MAG: HEAT repeat domain-containing protein [Candidatus Melainabacteria bacterium]|nr:HEAT repeat domain-containing protein [Candidatus Melainabacteria bacterium]
MRPALFALALLFSTLCSADEEAYRKRINAHLVIADRLSAVEEAQKALVEYPDSKSLQLAYIRALCEKGDETEAMEQWTETSLKFESEKFDRRMLEVLAWGVLNKGESSAQLNIRLNSMLGAAFTRDAKAIPMLMQHLRGSNALLRSIAVKIAASFADAPLKDEVARLLKEEKVWFVRLDVIQAVGMLRMHELKAELKEIIGNPRTLVEEKFSAIVALVSMYDKVEREELLSLVRSDRAGLRQLAAEVITHLNLKKELDLLLPLLKDTSPDVRISALNALALMRVQKIGSVAVPDLLEENLTGTAPEVAITAAYVLILLDEKQGSRCFLKWLKSDNPECRRLASGALAASGKFGVRLALNEIKETKDPYVKVNLAMGLIGQRVQVKVACDVIHKVLEQEKNALWMWDAHSNPLFKSLAPSRVKHIEAIPHYPAVVDQLVRLDLLSALSIVRYPKAQAAVKEFLQTRTWGVTGAAAATLLQEGDEGGLAAVRELLNDSDEKVRVQAAMILAMVGSDPASVKVLQEAYPKVDREMKVHILEALAHIGDRSSIPFLLDILKEPFQVLRVVAASALIQCLYH